MYLVAHFGRRVARVKECENLVRNNRKWFVIIFVVVVVVLFIVVVIIVIVLVVVLFVFLVVSFIFIALSVIASRTSRLIFRLRL